MTAPQDLEETLEVGHQIAEALIVPCRSLVLYFSTSHQQTATSSLSRAKLLAAVRWLCDATTTTLLCLATRTRHASRGRRRPKTTKILRWVSFPLRIIAIASTAAQQHSSTAAAAALQLQCCCSCSAAVLLCCCAGYGYNPQGKRNPSQDFCCLWSPPAA